ncbi:hypothetical protein [Sulfuracidifex tepidarius]|uniref:Uncharacterized protein n=1 Tax=Sulfuracidifex tepidarius TaxID=1294262 RepID=A0A510DUX2_9CREN|nr:hypothetical protein [Sulfuracidifex tepidarius]BBG24011.1 hypothetical protein IC006_1312 [Sulfuracidifex tepidarius]BBG26766.1 hypothetical protein IC007_1287 [Sulfuracidifex tepidarius]
MKFIDFILGQRASVIYSYYKLVNTAVVVNVGKALHDKGEKVCIVNGDNLSKNVDLEFPIQCDETSTVLAYEIEDKALVPNRFFILTTFDRRLKFKNVTEISVDKIGQNLYFASSEEGFRFRILNGNIVDAELSSIENEVLSFLGEFGTSTIKEICDVLSPRAKTSRDEIRQVLFRMKKMGMIRIEGNRVSIDNNGRLHG